MEYSEFIASKNTTAQCCGFDIARDKISPVLFDWQGDVAQIALKKGRYALFELKFVIH